jgi:hypothetical protein
MTLDAPFLRPEAFQNLTVLSVNGMLMSWAEVFINSYSLYPLIQ